jgi:hypothetical protein
MRRRKQTVATLSPTKTEFRIGQARLLICRSICSISSDLSPNSIPLGQIHCNARFVAAHAGVLYMPHFSRALVAAKPFRVVFNLCFY